VENSSKTGYTARVQGILAMSRSIGDIQCKEPVHAVSAEPEISDTLLAPDDAFILLASDGLFDAMSSQEAVDYIRKSSERHRVAQELAERALKDSKDNVTVMIIWLFWSATGITSSPTIGNTDSSQGIVLGKGRVTSEVLHKRARSASHLESSSGEGASNLKHRRKEEKKSSLTLSEKGNKVIEVEVEKSKSEIAIEKTEQTRPDEKKEEGPIAAVELRPEKQSLGSVERRHSMGSLSHSRSKSPSKDRKRGVLVTNAPAKLSKVTPVGESPPSHDTSESMTSKLSD
jgi:hypothetical protein